MWEEIGKACRWKYPRAPSARTIFEDERATEGILAFLWDTKVGCMVSIVAPRRRSGR